MYINNMSRYFCILIYKFMEKPYLIVGVDMWNFMDLSCL